MVTSSKDRKNVEELIKRSINDDEKAFGQLYDAYFEKVYRFVFYRVNHQETAEDLVAETFVKVWDGLDELNDASAFNGWIYQIARNLVIDHYRTRKPTASLEVLENVIEYEDNIIDRANLDFDLKNLLAVLDQLTEDQQLVIRLKFIEDLENREIAQILDKSEGTIRVIQHRAIAQLKKLLTKND